MVVGVGSGVGVGAGVGVGVLVGTGVGVAVGVVVGVLVGVGVGVLVGVGRGVLVSVGAGASVGLSPQARRASKMIAEIARATSLMCESPFSWRVDGPPGPAHNTNPPIRVRVSLPR